MGVIKNIINEVADELGLLKQEEDQLHARLKEIRAEKDLAKITIIKFGGTLTGEYFTAMVRPRHTKCVDSTYLKKWVKTVWPEIYEMASYSRHSDVLTVKRINDDD